MAYTIPFTDTATNPDPISVPDQTLNNYDTSLTFVGKNFPGYAQSIGKNFLQLLEHFAGPTEPPNKIRGQLWYDTGTSVSPARPQLKVYDGTRWTEAGNLKKGTIQPVAENSVLGDLWVDIANQQLYLYAGSGWVLVGPQFSEGSLSGLKAEPIIDRDTNTAKTVLIFYVSDLPVIIISKDTFTPKVSIIGFDILRQGINLSGYDFDLDGTMLTKFWGTSEKSNALVVGNNTIAAANFLRSDAVSTTNYTLNVRNGGGIVIGSSLETSLTTSVSGAILNHKTPGSPILLKTTSTGGISNTVITVTGDRRVGINTNPTATLDVNGSFQVNGRLTSTNTTASTDVNSGAIVVLGGVGIYGALNVGSNTKISGHLTVGSATTAGIGIASSRNEYHDIGSAGIRFNHVYSKNFTGDVFTGSFEGGLTGNVNGSAARLSNTSAFSMTGDVTSNTIPFNGSSLVETKNILTIARNALGIATITTATPHSYVTGYIVSVSCSNATFNSISTPIIITGPSTFTYQSSGATVSSGTSATGTITVTPGGSFTTVISDSIIADKTELVTSSDADYFLVYRATASPTLRKISKATLFSTAGTVPVGSIMPFGGDTPPAGYLLCDGSEQSKSVYGDLFSVIGYKYKASGLLTGYQTFALPDLRGRFPLGRDDMDNANTVNLEITASNATRAAITAIGSISTTFVILNSATVNGPFQTGKALEGTGLDITGGPVIITAVANSTPSVGYTTITVSMTSQTTTYPSATGLTLRSLGLIDAGGGAAGRVASATTIGNVSGTAQKTLAVNQLPEHLHDLKDTSNNQYYALRDADGTPPELEVSEGNVHFTAGRGHFLKNSGGIKTTGSIGQPVDIMNPYQTINYVIFTGRIL